MAIGRKLLWITLVAGTLGLAACSSGGGGSGVGVTVTGAMQDLTADPTGLTTVFTFSADPGVVTPANFATSGSQTAQTANKTGSMVTVTWDARVTPSDMVRAVGLPGVVATFVAVTTSDANPPTYSVTSATQVADPASVGGDTVVLDFSGANIVQSTAEDDANWTLTSGGNAQDLSDSLLVFDPGLQRLTITTGSLATLHGTFTLQASGVLGVADVGVSTATVNGAAAGDASAPSLTSADQNLTVDPFGRAIDFMFSEAMDPDSTPTLSNFGIPLPNLATGVTRVSDVLYRVTFNSPVVPGIDQVDVQGLTDSHGNALSNNGMTAVVSTGAAAAAYDAATEALTVQGTLGDQLIIVTTQALDPRDAVDDTKWTVLIGGNPVTMADQTLSYDLLTRTLTVDLDFDMTNGDAFSFTANNVVEIDGQAFGAVANGTVGGDISVPAVDTVTQNRSFDPTGMTIDIVYTEDVEQVSAEGATYTFTGGVNVMGMPSLVGAATVRVTTDAVVVPGDVTVDVSGTTDLAGNAMVAASTLAIVTTDSVAPTLSGMAANAIEGSANDTLLVNFNDRMIQAEVEMMANWAIESPVGTPLNPTSATISYDPNTQQATLVFAAPDDINLKRDDNVRVTVTGVRDIAGNTIQSGQATGNVVAESNLPLVESVWVQAAPTNMVHVRFSEACAFVDDLGGLTSYDVYSPGPVLKGSPTTAVRDADKMGVTLTYPFGVVAGSDFMDIRGVTDLAGNDLFPVDDAPVAAENATDLIFGAGSTLTTVSGENNDVIVIEFDQQPSTAGLDDPANFTIAPNGGGTALDLSQASFAFDGNTTLTIQLDGQTASSMATTTNYDVTIDGLMTAQGRAMPGPDTIMVVAAGDAVAPVLTQGLARIDASSASDQVLIQVDEAVDATSVAVLGNLMVGGIAATSATRVGPRSVVGVFPGGFLVGDQVDMTWSDLAGNAGSSTVTLAAADAFGPSIVSVSALAVSGLGGDTVSIDFDEPIDPATGFNLSNYTVLNGGVALDLSNATKRYVSASNRLVIQLPSGVELDPTQPLVVQAQNIEDFSGLVMNPPANLGGAIAGDTTPPASATAFVNLRADAGSLAVDVLFDEDVDQTFAAMAGNWNTTGAAVVMAVEVLGASHYRLTLDTPLLPGEMVTVDGISDVAGNTAVTFSVTPTL